ncbi:hypothetical protein [Embleya sp. NPDC020630]|uniref:hypothetical protein n=1 Tax=Embleya sp. NPDC020630 TaxID=3363979 RepID=UPI00379D5FAD
MVSAHPGVFAFPGHEAVRRARLDGIPARMLAGSSAGDWLFADPGLDPATRGCQSIEASDFLLRHRVFDPTSLLVLWQVGVIGISANVCCAPSGFSQYRRRIDKSITTGRPPTASSASCRRYRARLTAPTPVDAPPR